MTQRLPYPNKIAAREVVLRERNAKTALDRQATIVAVGAAAVAGLPPG